MTSSELPPCNSACPAERHGTRGAYLIGCRCDTARHAYTRYQKEWHYDRAHGRLRKVPVIGAQRRVQALMYIGWDLATIGRRLGRHRLNLGRYPVITSSLHLRIAALYDELADHHGPSPTTARHATSRGWLPPIAWDDDTIDDPDYDPLAVSGDRRIVDRVNVNRATAGQHVTLTRPERLEAVRQLHDRRLSYRLIAERLQTSTRQVHRDLSDLGLVEVAS